MASLTTGDRQPLAPTPANQPTNPRILHPSAQHGCVTQRRFLPTRAPSASSHLRDQDPSTTYPAPWCRYSYLAGPRWTNTSTVASCRGTALHGWDPASQSQHRGAPATPATPVSDTLGKRRTAAALPAGRCVGCPPPRSLGAGRSEGSKTPRQRPSHEYFEAPPAGGAQHAAAANRVAPSSAVLPMRYRSTFTSPPAAWDGADGEGCGSRPWEMHHTGVIRALFYCWAVVKHGTPAVVGMAIAHHRPADCN